MSECCVRVWERHTVNAVLLMGQRASARPSLTRRIAFETNQKAFEVNLHWICVPICQCKWQGYASVCFDEPHVCAPLHPSGQRTHVTRTPIVCGTAKKWNNNDRPHHTASNAILMHVCLCIPMFGLPVCPTYLSISWAVRIIMFTLLHVYMLYERNGCCTVDGRNPHTHSPIDLSGRSSASRMSGR